MQTFCFGTNDETEDVIHAYRKTLISRAESETRNTSAERDDERLALVYRVSLSAPLIRLF